MKWCLYLCAFDEAAWNAKQCCLLCFMLNEVQQSRVFICTEGDVRKPCLMACRHVLANHLQDRDLVIKITDFLLIFIGTQWSYHAWYSVVVFFRQQHQFCEVTEGFLAAGQLFVGLVGKLRYIQSIFFRDNYATCVSWVIAAGAGEGFTMVSWRLQY